MIIHMSDATLDEHRYDPILPRETQDFKGMRCQSANRLILLGAGPAVGNTSLSLEFALEYAMLNDKAVYFFSLEMSAIHIYHRLLSIISSVPLNKIIVRNYSDDEKEKIFKARDRLSTLNIVINDMSFDKTLRGRNINKIEESILEFEKPEFNKVGLVIVDYLQLVSNNAHTTSTVKEMTKILKKLKGLAKSKKMIVMANVNLGYRWFSTRQKRPNIDNFQRLLGDISPSDIVITVWRDMWNDQGEYMYNNYSDRQLLSEITVHKTKDGRLGTRNFIWNPNCLKFTELTGDCYEKRA